MASVHPQLRKMLPPGFFDDDVTGDLAKLIDQVFQPMLDKFYTDDVDRYPDEVDPDLAGEDSVNAMLFDMGNPFDDAFSLSLDGRRAVVRNLVPAYNLIGTDAGIIAIVRLLTGINVVQVVSPATVRTWVLGKRDLADTQVTTPPGNVDLTTTDYAFLGGQATSAYSFQIQVDTNLTPEQRQTITRIVRLIKPAHTHFYGIIEPGGLTPPSVWKLGQGKLGGTNNESSQLD